MKKIFLTIILFPFLTFAQTEHFGELIFTLINQGSSWNVTFNLTAIGARWDRGFELTEDYEIVTNTIHSTPPTQTVAYFDHVFDSWAGINPIFAFGLYKISAIENGVEQAYFYMDWRTSDSNPFGDVYFKYDVTNNRFRDKDDTQTIDKSYQTIWNLLGHKGSTLETSGFEDYWNNCLTVFDNGDAHPKFAWGPYPGFSNNYYKIYKKKGTPNFVLYDSTTSTTYVDVNEEILTGFPQANEGHIYYKITSVGSPVENPLIPPYESGYSNTVDIRSLMPPLEKKGVDLIINKECQLLQNYPNPFNPITIISYSLPVSGQVSLKVFDVLGREVALLVNEQKEAGIHKIEFDAKNLTSGIYFYSIQAGNYSETRKLILQK